MTNSESTAFVWLETRGFRSFGTEARRFELSAPLVVIHAGNSQGKTSLAESLEFLLTGRSSRRDVFGGAKAEYNGSLRNAHLPDDAAVWVAAGIRDTDGVVHEVRRTLTSDFAGAADCSSQLTVDGLELQDFPDFGLSLGDGAMGAPVLLQHTLRYVLSTEPKQRATYFKALLTLSDLDLLRQRIAAQRALLEQPAPDEPAVAAVRSLENTSLAKHATDLLAIDPTSTTAHADVEAIVVAAGQTLGSGATNLRDLRSSLDAMATEKADRLFPVSAFISASSMPEEPKGPDTSRYVHALDEIDQTVANLLPMVSALLAAPAYEHLDHTVDCPVCATPLALTPARIEELRDRLRAGKNLDGIAIDIRRQISETRAKWKAWITTVSTMVPTSGTWDESSADASQRMLLALCAEGRDKLDNALAFTAQLAAARDDLAAQVAAIDESLAGLDRAVERRVAIDADLTVRIQKIHQPATAFRTLRENDGVIGDLQSLIAPALEEVSSADGIAELCAVTDHANAFISELRDRTSRAAVIKRLNNVDRVLKKASSNVLDARFAEMSTTIEKWWLSIRPDELVGFAGVKRRAAGAIFVNLVAALQPQVQSEAVERDALGVYSDSQLNALGLSTFLARAELSGARTVVLDDPIPGSDGDHRLTFVQNTLGELLSRGQQVILTTYDPKLAEWAAATHTDLGPLTFDLNLLDATLGTEPSQTSDPFSRFMLQAEDNLNAPTAGGRRSACNAYRTAAERLAKQIIATNRSAAGVPTSVADVGHEAAQLGDLVPLVRGFALSNDEGGKWTVMPKVLNPGSHDDDVPSTLELKQIRGNLRVIAKNHRKKWTGGLVL